MRIDLYANIYSMLGWCYGWILMELLHEGLPAPGKNWLNFGLRLSMSVICLG